MKKNALVRIPEPIKHVILCGYKLVGGRHTPHGTVETEMEWSSKYLENFYGSLAYRFFKPTCVPTDIPRFALFAEKEIEKVVLKMKIDAMELPDVFSYVVNNFKSHAKSKTYWNYIQTAVKYCMYGRGSFKLMVKSGEVYKSVAGDHPLRSPSTSRARQILNPNGIGQKVAACLNTPILQQLSKTCNSFIYGMDTEQICDRFTNSVKPNWVSISLDGSSFDST